LNLYPPENVEALARTLLWDTGGLSAAEDGAPHTYMPIHVTQIYPFELTFTYRGRRAPPAYMLKKHLLLYLFI
jgi:hypothetical protein